ncbi:MAG TPA: hypothetical protein VF881_03720 [Polyangiaceae bacterium]
MSSSVEQPARCARLARFTFLAASFWLAGCGGSEPTPAAPAPTAEAPAQTAHRPKQRLALSGQLGSLDQRKVDETFARLMPRFGDCLSQGSSRVEFISGHVKFFVRIGVDGTARWAYLPECTIGDRDTERCMLNVVKSARWPVPLEGEGQAQKAFDFDPAPDVRDAVPWGADRVAKTLASARAKLTQCAQGVPGRYKATVYVHTNGTAMAAGVAPPDERGEGAPVDCMVDVIRTLKFPSPGSWPAKVMFDVD